ncbi:PREDICTED: uncharacterized protein K02A2.6-like, partial [Paramuricea clavata]
ALGFYSLMYHIRVIELLTQVTKSWDILSTSFSRNNNFDLKNTFSLIISSRDSRIWRIFCLAKEPHSLMHVQIMLHGYEFFGELKDGIAKQLGQLNKIRTEWEPPTWPPSIQMGVTAGIFLASILLKEIRYLVPCPGLFYTPPIDFPLSSTPPVVSDPHCHGVLNKTTMLQYHLHENSTELLQCCHFQCHSHSVCLCTSMHENQRSGNYRCSVCAEFQVKQQNQPMQSHDVPDRPWSRVSTDLFTLGNKDYVVLVNSYSDFLEVGKLKGTTSSAIIEFLKEQFSRHGIPDVLVSDNGPQYTSREFTDFTTEWEIKHVTSSPYHARSNGKSEWGVKIAKNLFKKAQKDNKDPWLALLDYRNTPTEGVQTSPCQRLMSRRTRTPLPVATSLLYPEVSEGIKERLQRKRQKAKSNFDRNGKFLPDLDVGQEVRVRGKRDKTWELGKCLEKLSDRSYMVQTNGEKLRRNREEIRPCLDVEERNSANNPETEVSLDAESDQHEPTVPVESKPNGSQRRSSRSITATPDCRGNQTRSSRTIKAPARYKDYKHQMQASFKIPLPPITYHFSNGMNPQLYIVKIG